MLRGGDTYVVDIESVGAPWNTLDERTHEYLLKRAANDAEREAVPRRLGLSPGTGRVIVIGMLNVTAGKGGVLLEGDSKGWTEDGPDDFLRFAGSEQELLAEFWRVLGSGKVRRIVTFNGRQFDGPFLMIRSAMLGVAPSMNLVGYRYSMTPHCDLAEVLNFHGAVRSNYSLDYWCRRFGITSPKEQDIEGSKVQEYYENGRLEEIASYCCRDVVATAKLYEQLDQTLIPLIDKRG